MNAANADVTMPVVGLGTGGYGNKGPDTYTYPECWSDGKPGPDGVSFFDCADMVIKVAALLSLSSSNDPLMAFLALAAHCSPILLTALQPHCSLAPSRFAQSHLLGHTHAAVYGHVDTIAASVLFAVSFFC
jgi:hypothetical protein